MKKIAIIGGGSWGTALAIALTRSWQPHQLALWEYNPEIVETMRTRRVNEVYLPGFELPPQIGVTGSFPEALTGAEIVLGVMPSAHARKIYRAMRPHLDPHIVFVSATKGIEPGTHARMSEVISAEITQDTSPRIAVLSGPSFAAEVARGDPTAVALASADATIAVDIQKEFSGPTFRLYTNDDVIGTEIAGSVKNVIAIAAGICIGQGFGSNTMAALVTRGLTEIVRLAVALGGRPDTIAGLAGIGDLMLTSTGALSRNRFIGIELGKGRQLAEILAATPMVVEGVATTAATLELARRTGIEMPITEQVQAVLTAGRAPKDAIRELMERRLKQE
jgi:glycerol-3-phosphate dehydrogenase (NAD(P)+)